MALVWRAPDFDPAEAFAEEEPTAAPLHIISHNRSTSAAVAVLVGPLMSTGDPLLTLGASCDPGTGGGQCLRLVVRERPRAAPEPFGWEAGEAGRKDAQAWWAGVGERLGKGGAPPLDVDAARGERGDGGALDVVGWEGEAR